MSGDKTSFARFCSYFAIMIAAVLLAITHFFKANMNGDLLNALVIIKDVLVLFGLFFGAYEWANSQRSKGWLIAFIVAIVLYVVVLFF